MSIGVNACTSSALTTILPVALTKYLSVSYIETSTFMIVGTLASTIAVHVLGRISDRPGWRYLTAIGSALCGLAGALALSAASGYWPYLAIYCSLVAIGASLFPQLMALAFLRANKAAPIMRAVVSGGWVVGPPVAGLVLGTGSLREVFLVVAVAYAALVILLFALRPLIAAPGAPKTSSPGTAIAAGAPARAVWSTVSILAAIHFVLGLCALAVPWRILELGGTAVDVGMAFAIAAVVEISVIVFAGRVIEGVGRGKVLVGCAALIALNFLFGANASQAGGIFVVSLFNGAITGMMMGASLLILQAMFPDRPGRATSLYSNVLRLSYVGAILAAGLVAQLVSVAAVFWIASVLACCIVAVQLLGRPSLQPSAHDHPQVP